VLTKQILFVDEYLVDTGLNQLTADESVQPRFVLLAPSRVNQRDALGWARRLKRSPQDSNTTAASTAATSEPTSLTRGYAQTEDFLNDVDITEENLENKIQNQIQNQSLTISNVSGNKQERFGRENLRIVKQIPDFFG
jgi:hypothetical protein